MRFVFSFITIMLLIVPSFAQDEARLLRFPATYGNQIVFTYAGDLYTVSTSGGTARKLTNHDGFEMFARFSPDGKNLAFTGQYDGNTEVFLMPSEGGEPQRLTFTATLIRDDISDRMGPNNIVMAWKNKSDEIAFRSRMKSYNSFNGSLYTVSTDASLPEQIPVPRVDFVHFHRMTTKWPIIESFVNSEPGKDIVVVWLMIYGSMIIRQNKLKTLPAIRHRILSQCGMVIKSIFSQIVMPINV